MISCSFLRSHLPLKLFNSYPPIYQPQWLWLYLRCNFSWLPCSIGHNPTLTLHRKRKLPTLVLHQVYYSRLVLLLKMDKNKRLSRPLSLRNQRSDLVSCWLEAVLDEGYLVVSLTSIVLRVCLESIVFSFPYKKRRIPFIVQSNPPHQYQTIKLASQLSLLG